MKKLFTQTIKLVITLFVFGIATNVYAQDPSAILDLESTTQGVLVPRMTTAERIALPGINTPSQGLLVYDTETSSFWYFDNMMWNELASGSTLPEGLMTTGGSVSPQDSISSTLPPVVSTIFLSDPGVIDAATRMEVCLNIEHTFVGDLDITLKAPDGSTIIDLTSDNGSGGDNFTNTCFSDGASTSITAIVNTDAPFSNSYLPEMPLSTFIGQNIAGAWELTIVDDAGGDQGNLIDWSIKIGSGEAIVANTIEDGDGDTKIQVEETLDDDLVRFDVQGVEVATMHQNRLNLDQGGFNTFIGNVAGLNNTILPADTGQRNTFIGHGSGINNTVGSKNTYVGFDVGFYSTAGTNNVFVGDQSGVATLGSFNTCIGARSGYSGGNGNVKIGFEAGFSDGGDNKLYIDNSNTAAPLIFGDFGTDQVAIGGSDMALGYTLSVNGKIATEEVLVDLASDWPDYVFHDDYILKSLEEVETHIAEHGHLPNVPSAQEVEDNGLVLGEMNRVLMEKIEELTLYLIASEKKNQELEKRITALESATH
jgi:subtilisin-like proprotein convertase family protein